MVDFESLFSEDDDVVIDPRDIFLTLNKNKKFSFPRDIQTEVLKSWFEIRNEKDTVVKLNVGSGKTLVGLLMLQSSLNEGKGPAFFICPDNQLVSQVIAEAEQLGLVVTDNPKDTKVESGEMICVTNIYTVFNGMSVFGVERTKIKIGTIVIDDAHACISKVSEQFRLQLPRTHEASKAIFELVQSDLKKQSHARSLSLEAGDPNEFMEVPFWTWQSHKEKIIEVLHKYRNDDELRFVFPLIREVIQFCRCIVAGQKIEIEPNFPPVDIIKSFARANRRIYMTATLSDDSVLFTQLGASIENIKPPIVPVSSQSMGERMILMPQELNPDIEIQAIKEMLIKLSKTFNVVVIVPSREASLAWKGCANEIAIGDQVAIVVENLKSNYVGLVVLVNRYDGIDLPDNACRVLALFGLPEINSLKEAVDLDILVNSDASLVKQMQRIEQGMGRGVRSNDDHCVVLLCGTKLTSRIKSHDGKKFLSASTRAQLDISERLAKQLNGVAIGEIEDVINKCLFRDQSWVTVSKRALLKAKESNALSLDETSIATRKAFDCVRTGAYQEAIEELFKLKNEVADNDVLAWLKVREAEITNFIDPVSAQKILLSAHKLNSSTLKPIDGVNFEKLKPHTRKQAEVCQEYNQSHFLEATDRILRVKALLEDLSFKIDHKKFEAALDEFGKIIGLAAQRPEKAFGIGPDNIWTFSDANFLVIECKNEATTENGISKSDLGQLEQAVSWFEEKYTASIKKTPIIIHHSTKLAHGASSINGARVITETELGKLKAAMELFAKSLGDINTLNNINSIGEILTKLNFTSSTFVQTYTKDLKK